MSVCFVCWFVFGVGFSACSSSSSVAAEKQRYYLMNLQ